MAEIHVSGAAARAFTIPAARPVAYQFYSSLPRILPFLPRIELVSADQNEVYRIAYRSLELNVYDVDIPCDLQVFVAEGPAVLRIRPAEQSPFPAVKPYATLRSCRAMGEFEIESRFLSVSEHETRIDYQLKLSSKLPKPTGLTLLPSYMMHSVVEKIVQMRINEIVDHFVVQSTAAFRTRFVGD